MATLSRIPFSGSTHGTNIKVTQTATAGDLIHTATTSATLTDRLYIAACNTSAAAVKLTIEFGGVVSPDDLMEKVIPPESGWIWVVPGFLLRNTLICRAFAASANVINVNGYVSREA